MRRALLAASALILASVPARAAEVVLGAEASADWDNNIANTIPATSDFSFRLAPTLRLREVRGDLTYDLYYRPRYQIYTRFHELNEWEHLVNGRLSYRIGPTTKVSLANQFYRFSNTTQQVEQIVDQNLLATSALITTFGPELANLNSVSGSIEHSFAPLWFGKIDLSNDYYDPDPKVRANSSSTVAQGSLLYGITRLDRIGGGLSATFQEFSSTEFQQESSTNYYQVFASWNHEFSPTWSFDVQAGPTWVDPSPPSQESFATLPFGEYPTSTVNGRASVIGIAACPPDANGDRFLFDCRITDPTAQTFPVGGIDVTGDGVADAVLASPTLAEITSTGARVPTSGQVTSGGSSLTYFAAATMTKRWTETIDTSIRYTRNAASTASNGVATIVDVVTATANWRPSPLWTFQLTGLYTHRSESSEGASGQALLVGPSPGVISDSLGTPLATLPITRIIGVRFQNGLSKRDIDQYAAGLRADYRITKNLSTFARSHYFYQQSKIRGISAFDSSYDSYTFELGLRYEFDPFQL